ncbi:aminoacyl-tRNA deacylase [Brevibacillus daliensis]|uniref:aminoacyl-tRNA deacylase n=1 Tax=Brevibacillus daliensis TaxID=2892995 RepID=UPI001E31A1B6|nr:YbaK/EbsC family protein [Brevibacillus daliensis]
MDQYAQKLTNYLIDNQLTAVHLPLERSCHSVQEAAEAVQASPEDLVKNICMIDHTDRLIVVIVKGEDRASTTRVAKALDMEKPRLATEEEILERTGYPAGGVPSLGFMATFLVDPRVTEKKYVYTGGGSPNALTKISVEELLQTNKGMVIRVRK